MALSVSVASCKIADTKRSLATFFQLNRPVLKIVIFFPLKFNQKGDLKLLN